MKDIEYVIGPSSTRFIDWKELWQFRELFHFFALRDLKVKYKQAVLGVVWVVLQPVVTVLIFSTFFGRSASAHQTDMNYAVFIFSGLLTWNLFSLSVSAASNSMVANAGIIKKIYFPRIIIPISAIMVTLIDFVVTFSVFAIALVYYRAEIDFSKALLFWPLAILFTLAASIGVSCWLAALNVKYRDFRYVIPFALQLGLFISPILYDTSFTENPLIQYLLALNPMYAPIQLFRAPLVQTPLLIAHNIPLLMSLLMAIFFLAGGVYYFRKTEAYFADIA